MELRSSYQCFIDSRMGRVQGKKNPDDPQPITVCKEHDSINNKSPETNNENIEEERN